VRAADFVLPRRRAHAQHPRCDAVPGWYLRCGDGPHHIFLLWYLRRGILLRRGLFEPQAEHVPSRVLLPRGRLDGAPGVQGGLLLPRGEHQSDAVRHVRRWRHVRARPGRAKLLYCVRDRVLLPRERAAVAVHELLGRPHVPGGPCGARVHDGVPCGILLSRKHRDCCVRGWKIQHLDRRERSYELPRVYRAKRVLLPTREHEPLWNHLPERLLLHWGLRG
jgi:hypothetical protein